LEVNHVKNDFIPFEVVDLSRNHYRERSIPLVKPEADVLNELISYYHNDVFHVLNLRKKLNTFCTSEFFTMAFTAHRGRVASLGLFSQTGEVLTDAITKFPNLLELYLFNSIPEPRFKEDEEPWRLKTLPGNIDKLKSLQLIEMQNFNELKTLPESFGRLASLKKLEISGCGFTSIPECIGNLKSLKELSFWAQDKKLEQIPESIGNLSSLEFLDLGENSLQSLPESFGKLKALKKLFLHYNQFDSLPSSVCELTFLEELDLDHNNLGILPDCIGNLTSLTEFSLKHNNITSFPS